LSVFKWFENSHLYDHWHITRNHFQICKFTRVKLVPCPLNLSLGYFLKTESLNERLVAVIEWRTLDWVAIFQCYASMWCVVYSVSVHSQFSIFISTLNYLCPLPVSIKSRFVSVNILSELVNFTV
jgi:hypothetical protein